MKLPGPVLATRDRYVAAFPLWVMPEGPAAEDRARAWTIGLVSQIVFEHGESYGCKRADPGRPISKDAVAQQMGASLTCWDMLTGAGSGSPVLVVNPDSQDITGQVFEFIAGRDVIEGEIAPEPPEPIDVPPVIPYNEQYSVEFGLACNDVYRECGATPDGGMIAVHAQRCAWDFYCGGMAWEDAKAKHVDAFRAEYGLPPLS